MARGAIGLVLGILLAGCIGGQGVEETEAVMHAQRDAAVTAADEIAERLGDPQLAFLGAPRRTGGDPGLRVQFVSGATVPDDGVAQERRIQDVARVLDGLGWTLDQSDPDLVWATRDDLRVKVSPAARRGSDAVSVELQGPAVDAPEDAFDQLVPVKAEQIRP